jgi:hypothetical protein
MDFPQRMQGMVVGPMGHIASLEVAIDIHKRSVSNHWSRKTHKLRHVPISIWILIHRRRRIFVLTFIVALAAGKTSGGWRRTLVVLVLRISVGPSRGREIILRRGAIKVSVSVRGKIIISVAAGSNGGKPIACVFWAAGHEEFSLSFRRPIQGEGNHTEKRGDKGIRIGTREYHYFCCRWVQRGKANCLCFLGCEA